MGLTKFFNKNSNLINLLIISPALFLVDFNYSKFAILALVLGFLILIQNLFLILYKLTSDPEKKKHWTRILTNVLNIIIIVPICLYQYVNPSFSIYNKFIAVFLAVYSSIKVIFKRKYENKKNTEIVNNIKNYNKKSNNKECSKDNVKSFQFTSSSSGDSPTTHTCESSTNYSYSTELSTKEATLLCRKFNIKSD